MKEASPVTKALAGEHLPEIEEIAERIHHSRGTVIRSIIHDWFLRHREELRNLQIVLAEEPMNLMHSIDEAVILLGISHKTVRRHIKNGKIKVVRIGQRVFVSEDEIRRLTKEE